MTTKRRVLAGLLLLVAGCGGGGRSGAKVSSPGGDTAVVATEDGAGAAFGDAVASEAAPAHGAAIRPAGAPPPRSEDKREASARDDVAAPEPARRPGLGTEFGEARTSHVRDVSFVRDSAAPFATVTLHYDDRRGVDALARRHARRDTFRELPAGGGAVTVSVRDAQGDPLEAVHVGDRTFVIGEAGQRYVLVLTNRTDHRFEAVASVDGLDVVNGRPGSLAHRGYVLMPFATLEIEGFRESAARVATFRFSAVSESYAGRTGNARNVGVIGVALFSERGDSFVPEDDLRLRDTARPFPADPRFAAPPR